MAARTFDDPAFGRVHHPVYLTDEGMTIILDETAGGQHPLSGCLRTFQDEAADVVVMEPPLAFKRFPCWGIIVGD